MMKMKRMVASILVLLLAVSLLPIGAMAEGNTAETTIPTTTEDIGTNNGKIENNNHTVENNVAVAVDIDGVPGYKYETGNIENNNNVVKTNGTPNGGAESGIVEKNYGTVGVKGDDASGNYGTIYYNQSGGKVLINQSTGVVDRNEKGGTIVTNNGTVGSQNQFGDVMPTSGNYGTVETNNAGGKVLINQKDGTVEINAAGGIVETNKGTIVTNNGTVGKRESGASGSPVIDGNTGNFGTITTNYGYITQNKGIVVTNEKNANTIPGNIHVNDGTVETNKGTVWDNNGTVETNKSRVENNKAGGTVQTNEANCNVAVNEKGGTVVTNNGTVETNNGKVETNNRVVKENHGTVITSNYFVSDNYDTVITNNNTVTFNYDTVTTNNGIVRDNYGTVTNNNIDGVVTNRNRGESTGTVTNNFGTFTDVDGKTYCGLSYGSDTKNLTLINGKVEKGGDPINLDEIAAAITSSGLSLSGHKLTGYTWLTSDGTKVADTADYTMNAPTWLKLLWEKIATAVAPSNEPEAKPVKAAAIPNTVKAEDVKVGTVVRVKGQLFRVIEMDDGSMTIVTMGKLSKKDMEDLMAFLSTYFTPEQIELLMGDPELISGELAEQLFGGNTGHIVFKAAKNLFA